MEGTATIVVKERRPVEKEGKKTFYVVVEEEGTEYTTFEHGVYEKCQVGAKVEVKFKTEKKGEKTYYNMKEVLNVLDSGTPLETPPAPPGAVISPPHSPNGSSLSPEMIEQISGLIKTVMFYGDDGHSKQGWIEHDSHMCRQAMVRCAVMTGASGDDAIILAEHYYSYVMRGTQYASQAIARLRGNGSTIEPSILPMNGENGSQPKDTVPPKKDDSEHDWAWFYDKAKQLGFSKPSDVYTALSIKSMNDWDGTKEDALAVLGQLVNIDWRTGMKLPSAKA